MKQRRLEVFIAIVLIIVSYTGNYYLYEPGYPGIDPKAGLGFLLRLTWTVLMALIGYYGLLHHEVKWVKSVWIIVYGFIFVLLLINKLAQVFLHLPFLLNIAFLLEPPLVYAIAVYLPRWLKFGDKPPV